MIVIPMTNSQSILMKLTICCLQINLVATEHIVESTRTICKNVNETKRLIRDDTFVQT